MNNKQSIDNSFAHRHIGPDESDIKQMLGVVGSQSLDEFIASVLPLNIRAKTALALSQPQEEHDVLQTLKSMVSKNNVYRSLIGMGYYDTITPPVIQRNILENP